MKNPMQATLYRLTAAIICTGFSYIAIEVSFVMKNPLFIASWVAYFLIIVFWVKNNSAPKPLLIFGSIIGSISVVFSMFIGLLWAFPAIALIIHVIICSYSTATSQVAEVNE